MLWGGSEALWYATALHAIQQNDEIFVSVSKWDEVPHQIKLLQQKGIAVHFRKRTHDKYSFSERMLRIIQNRVPSLKQDYQSIVAFKPDMVFISQAESFDFALYHKRLYNLLMLNKISYSIVCHSIVQQYSYIPPKEIYPGAIEVFQNAKQVFFVSKRQWQLTERRLVRRLTNAQFTWNPLNLKPPQHPLPWIKGDIFQMAIVGSFFGHKGQDTAFEVLSEAQWKQRKWNLNIYGNGEGDKYLKDLAVFYGIQNQVIFHGHVSDIIKIWQQNHILLIPSAQEGLPISLTEAMACGRPAIVTDVGDNTELINEDETGFIAAAPTTASFSKAMEKAWQKNDTWEQMGLNSFDLISMRLNKTPEINLYDTLKNLAKKNAKEI